jgi:hypothetical protein
MNALWPKHSSGEKDYIIILKKYVYYLIIINFYNKKKVDIKFSVHDAFLE